MKHESNDFSYDLAVQKRLPNLEYCIFILLFFWQQNHNIMPKFCFTYALIYLFIEVYWMT